MSKMSVIEFAEHRLAEEERERELGADNRHDIQYWAAYLDGARAQRDELTRFPSMEGSKTITLPKMEAMDGTD